MSSHPGSDQEEGTPIESLSLEILSGLESSIHHGHPPMIHRPVMFYFYPSTPHHRGGRALQSIGKLPSFVGRPI